MTAPAELVEAMARAIYVADCDHSPRWTWEEITARDLYLDMARDALKAASQAGWVVVPREPSEAMLHAGAAVEGWGVTPNLDRGAAGDTYRAMLSAGEG